MTSQVITLAETSLRQTTLRVDAVLLRKARFLLDEEGKSINEFLVEQLAAYVQRREQAQPQDQEGEAHAS
jgi:hypothetical protein